MNSRVVTTFIAFFRLACATFCFYRLKCCFYTAKTITPKIQEKTNNGEIKLSIKKNVPNNATLLSSATAFRLCEIQLRDCPRTVVTRTNSNTKYPTPSMYKFNTLGIRTIVV